MERSKIKPIQEEIRILGKTLTTRTPTTISKGKTATDPKRKF